MIEVGKKWPQLQTLICCNIFSEETARAIAAPTQTSGLIKCMIIAGSIQTAFSKNMYPWCKYTCSYVGWLYTNLFYLQDNESNGMFINSIMDVLI